MNNILISIIVAIAVAGAALAAVLRRFIVNDGCESLLFRGGRFVRVLKPGTHWVLGQKTVVRHVDVREAALTVAGQEVLTSDNLALKITVILHYQVVKVDQALRTVQNYAEQLHLAVQDALRSVVAGKTLDQLLAQRVQVVEAMTPLVTAEAERVGANLLRLVLRDFMLAGELKQAYADTVKARLEGLATLERARGETAAMRHLVNATQLMETHPGLLQLRYLQTIDQAVTAGKGHTLMVGLPRELTPLGPAREIK
jgi:regulator of protease activity HflC (stomatin/prohibitin superfamily)